MYRRHQMPVPACRAGGAVGSIAWASRLCTGTIAGFVALSVGGRNYCDINELPKFVKP
jgi:hypothetical protein